MQEQTSQPIPECFYKADREAAKAGLSPMALAYVEKLEDALKVAEKYEEIMRGRVHSPEQHALSSDLLIKMSKVNFLAESDTIEPEEDELPRDVIFSGR